MSVINSQPLIGASGNQGTAYNLTRSLRFRSSASAYLNRTPASAGNRRTATFSFWIKRGTLSADHAVYSLGAYPTNLFEILFLSDNTLYIQNTPNSTTRDFFFQTTQVFRDPSAWYHIVLQIDTTQATSSNRAKLYINGSQVTAFSTATYPNQNTDLNLGLSTANQIGRRADGNYYQDAYLAEFHHIDGQSLDASSFGETDTATGVWKPKKYTGTYGTNGFYLKFDNLTSTSTLGNDSSGNSNTWTVNNISLTSGSTYDSMKDVPTLTDADTANYAVLNPLNSVSGGTLSNANLTWQSSAGSTRVSTATTTILPSSKTYFEMTVTTLGGSGTYAQIGIVPDGKSLSSDIGVSAGNGYSIEDNQGNDIRLRLNGSSVTVATAVVTGDTLQVAVDQSTGKIWFGRNNTWYNSTGGTTGDPAAGTNETATVSTTTDWYPAIAKYATGGSYSVNFGQRPFAYTPPSGFKALNTFNLPTPTIGATASTQANKYFDATLYTGNGASRSIVNSGAMSPDLVWIKNRSQAYAHRLFDTNRGAEVRLFSNTTDAEGTSVGSLTAFNSDGFSLGADTAGPAGYGVNENGSSFVAWQWRASDSTAVSNTSGTITSTVSANTTAGFSIVTYTGNGSTATVGHGLGVAPSMVIIKGRSTTLDWRVWHTSLAATYDIQLNTTAAAAAASAVYPSAPTSTVINIGSGTAVNTSSSGYVAYCFAEVAGYSKFGSYTGNGSTDGTFVFTGFRPAFVIIKQSSAAGRNWIMFDNKRDTKNEVLNSLEPSNSDAEYPNSTGLDFLSNGIKIRSTNPSLNSSGATYIYMAFAEAPQKFSLAR